MVSNVPLIAGLLLLGTGFGFTGSEETARRTLNHIDQPAASTENESRPLELVITHLTHPYGLAMLLLGVIVLSIWVYQRAHRLPALPRHRPLFPALGFAAFALTLGCSFIVQIAIAIAAGATAETVETMPASKLLRLQSIIRLGDGTMYAAVVIALMLVERHGRIAALWRAPPSEPPASQLVALRDGVIAFFASWPVVAGCSFIITALLILVTEQSPDTIAHGTLRLFTETRGSPWLPVMIAIVIIVGPAAEEFLYRVVLQRTFRSLRLRPWVAIVLTSAIFAVMHLAIADPGAILPLFVLSLTMGWVYERTGRFIAPFILHALFNAANVILLLLSTPAPSV